LRWLAALLVWASAAQAQVVEVRDGDALARFENPTNRYGHGIMGDLPEWGRLCLMNAGQIACVDLPETSVFEDIAPRLADLDGDGWMEAVVIESSVTGGASLVVYRLEKGKLQRIATPPIGQRNRWLAPAGIADFDGDGYIEIAYVDRPHLAKILRVWRYKDGRLEQLAAAAGITNHRIGEDFITGGVRDCGDGPEMVLADAQWQSVIAVRFDGNELQAEAVEPFSAAAVARALQCK